MTLTARPGLAILFVLLAVLALFLALSLSGTPAQAQDGSEDEPSELSYLTVVVTEDDSDPDNVFTTFTITWNDAEDCSASYNAYLDGVVGDPIHLGSAASEGEQIAASLTNVSAESMGFDAKLYCGTIGSGRLVDSLWIPEYSRSFDTVPISRAYLPKPGTYSTEPGLTVLTVSSGTLTPAFHSQTLNYTVPDVANADGRITLTTTTKADYYTVAFIPGSLYFYISSCSHGGQQTSLSYQDDTGNPLYPLTDADANTPGFQMDLDEGENVFVIHVWPNCENGHIYKLTVTRATNAPANTPATGAPTISGAAQVGETLTVDTSGIDDADGMSGAVFSYQWLANDAEITGATSNSYTLVDADLDKAVKVRVIFNDDDDNEETLTSEATASVAPRPNTPATGLPTISGTAQVGETLTVDTSGIDDADGIGNATFSYQWIAGTTDISGATGSSYAPLVADLGKTIKVRVSFDDDRNFLETLTSEATATVVTPLTAEFQDAPDKHLGTGFFTFDIAFSEPISISYKTLRDDSLEVTNGSATKAKRVNGQSDLWEITVKPDSDADVTVVLPITGDCVAQDAVCTRDGTELSNRSELTVPGPAAANSPATGAPSISGTAQVGETLTVDTSGIDDADGMSGAVFSYQWLADGVDIAGATSDSYTLVDADLDKAVKVRVIFNDDDNNEETLTSPATAAVASETAVPDAPQSLNVSPDDTGTLDVSWEAPASDGGSAITKYRVQWKETAGNWDAPADVSEETATGTTHTITGLTDGVEYTVRIIAVNDVGDGPPSGEASGTPREATAPVLTKATVKSVHLGTQPEAAEANSGDEPVLVGSVTVVVTQDNSDPDNVITSFAVTWRDYKDCASEYNAYLATHLYGVPVIGGGTYLEGFQIHLGSAASADSEIAKSLSNVQDTSPGLGFEVKVYCGTFESESGRGVSFVYVPQGILHRPQPGTHSSEPGLTALTVNPGTLSPEFHNHTVEYTVGDVPNANDKITVTTTVKTGLTVGIIPWDARPIFWLCSPGAGGWRWSCSEPYEDEDILPDADVDAPGYQLALEEGDNHFAVFVWNADEDARLEFTTYILTVTRAAMTPLQTRSKESSRDTGVLNRGSRYLSLDVGTAEETASPDLILIVAGTFLTLTYDEALDEDSVPATGAFTVAVSGTAAEVSHVSVSGSAVTLMLASAVTSEDTATVSYAAPTDAAAPRIQDDAGNPAASFSDQDVENNTPPPANTPATGAPTISGTAQVGKTLTVDTTAISDADGLDNVGYSYQWLADDTEVAGATSSSYTLVDADKGKTIKVRVSFIDDKSNPETLTSAATAAVEAASPAPGPITGFTVVDTSDQSVEGALADGGTLALDDPVGGSFGIRADLESGATIGSMRLQLTGAKTHDQTENIAPYSLYGDSGGNLSGESLPVGEYTLTATAYSEARLGGNVLGTLKVSFSVTATQQTNTPATGLPIISGTARVGETLKADISGIADVDGMSRAVFSYQWLANEVNIDTDIAGATDPTYTLVADDVGKAIRVRVSFMDGASNVETLTSEATATVVTPLTAEFQDAPDKHLGTGFFTFDIAFSEPISISYKTLRDDSLEVTNGSATKAKRVDGQSDRWEITVEPDSNAAVTVVLPITEDCGAQDAVCTRDGTELSNRSELTVPGPAAANSPATGAPSISGTAQVGETLTVDTSGIDDADGMSGAVFSYQWLADGVDIAGATSDSYTLVDADLDKAVKVRVIFNDDDNNEETLTSPATAAVASETAVPDAPQSLNVSPDDTGTLDVSWEAPADDGGSPITGYKVQWKSGSEDYDGSAGSTRQAEITDPASRTHTITGLTDGVEYAVRVIAVNDVGDGPPSDEATGTPRETTPPELSTATVDGTTLTLTYDEALDENSEPSSDAFSVTVGGTGRAVDGVSVSGSSVILTLGSAVAVEETVTVSYTVPTDAAAPRIQDEAGNPAASFSDQDVENNTPPPANTPATGAPTISGTVRVGETLTVDTTAISDADGLDNVGYSYQWLANGADIAGATSSSYTLVDADKGKTIHVKVSFRDDKNNPETLTSAATAAVEPRPNSPATGAPTISGTAQVGETLTAETRDIEDDDGLDNAVFTYQWLANGADITGATDPTYTLVDADLDKAVKVRVIFTDNADNEETLTSEATAAVEPRPNSPATGAPTISGTAQVGETLTAETSAIADADGMSGAVFIYQWLADDADIAGATSDTYTLVDTDVGKAIKVKVSFRDDRNNPETLTSAATAAVEPRPNNPATGAPTISGTAQVGETLTVDTSGIDDADGMSGAVFSYQWLADSVDIAGATSDTYTPVADDVDKAIKVKVSFRDDRNHQESLTSEATAAVTAAADESAVWSATLTVGSIADFRGFWKDVGMGELTSEVFTLDGVDYTVKVLADSNGLQFELTLDKALPVGFTLQVGATTLSSQDASIREYSSGATQYGWANQGVMLADVDTVEVSLTASD